MTPFSRFALLTLVFATAAAACGRNWDDFDPRLTDETATTTGAGGQSGVGGGGAAGGTGGMSGSGGQGGTPTLCGGVGVLADDFDDGVDNPLMTGTWQESEGRLMIPVPAGEIVRAYSSQVSYLMEGRALSLEIVSVPLDAGFYFSLDTDSNDWIEFFIADGILRSIRCSDGSCITPNSETFDADAHRFWQIRQENNMVFYEVSSDGSDWQPFGSTQGLGTDEPLTLNIGFYDETPSMMEREIVVDNLSAMAEQHCPPSFEDDFNDNVLHPRWTRSWENDGVDIEEKDGELEVDLDIGVATEGAAIETKRAFDISGATITLEVTEGAGPGEPGQAWFLLRSLDTEDAMIFNPDVETLYLHEVIDDNWESTLIPYDPQTMRWLRFREEGGLIHFEVAPTNTPSSFVTVHSAAPTFDITATQLIIGGAGSSMGLSAPHEVKLDNFSARVP